MDSVSAVCGVRMRPWEDSLTDEAADRPTGALLFRRVNGRCDKARFTAEQTNCGVVPFGYNDAPSARADGVRRMWCARGRKRARAKAEASVLIGITF